MNVLIIQISILEQPNGFLWHCLDFFVFSSELEGVWLCSKALSGCSVPVVSSFRDETTLSDWICPHNGWWEWKEVQTGIWWSSHQPQDNGQETPLWHLNINAKWDYKVHNKWANFLMSLLVIIESCICKIICVHALGTSSNVAIPANKSRLMGHICVPGNSHSDA